MTYDTSTHGAGGEYPPVAFRAVRVPADVNRPDTLLAGLTARQLIVLGMVAAALYAAYDATRSVVPPMAAAGVAVVAAGAAFAVVTLRRDGIGVDQLVVAAVRYARRPRRLAPHPGRPVPPWAGAGVPAQPAVGQLRLPATGVDRDGVLDLGGQGAAVVCAATTVNFALRTPAEQDALVGGYAAWLNSLTGPVQVVVRADRINLDPVITAVREHAAELPDPALEAAALAHAEFLSDLADGRDLLRRQVLLVIREPVPAGTTGRTGRAAARTRAMQRAGETAAALAGVGVRVTVLDGPAATAALATAADPTRPSPPAGLALAGDTITGPDPTDPTVFGPGAGPAGTWR